MHFVALVLALLSSSQTARILNQEFVIPNGGVTPPFVLQSRTPSYTKEAFAKKIEGTVTIVATFDIDGNFKVLRIDKGLGFGLDESALAAIQQWRFGPAYQSGRRVSVVANIDVVFKLEDETRRQLTAALQSAHQTIELLKALQKRQAEKKPF